MADRLLKSGRALIVKDSSSGGLADAIIDRLTEEHKNKGHAMTLKWTVPDILRVAKVKMTRVGQGVADNIVARTDIDDATKMAALGMARGMFTRREHQPVTNIVRPTDVQVIPIKRRVKRGHGKAHQFTRPKRASIFARHKARHAQV